jgi:hypothetical protein
MQRKLLNGRYTNAGLASMAGSVGSGVEKAGQGMVNLGGARVQQAKDEAAKKEKQALRGVTAKYNKAVNPSLAGEIGDENLGMIKLSSPQEPKNVVLKEGEALYSNDGKQLIKLDKETTKKVKSKMVDNEDNVHLIFEDGSTKNTNVKSKDYWKSKGGSGGSGSSKKVPPGYVYSGNFNISDDLDYELAVGGAYFTDDKTGVRYVNVNKLNALKNLGDIEIE